MDPRSIIKAVLNSVIDLPLGSMLITVSGIMIKETTHLTQTMELFILKLNPLTGCPIFSSES